MYSEDRWGYKSARRGTSVKTSSNVSFRWPWRDCGLEVSGPTFPLAVYHLTVPFSCHNYSDTTKNIWQRTQNLTWSLKHATNVSPVARGITDILNSWLLPRIDIIALSFKTFSLHTPTFFPRAHSPFLFSFFFLQYAIAHPSPLRDRHNPPPSCHSPDRWLHSVTADRAVYSSLLHTHT